MPTPTPNRYRLNLDGGSFSPDSSVAGFLVPEQAAPPGFIQIWQPLVVGITGLPGNLVRPRWQPAPPQQPAPTVNWCAIGEVSVDVDDTPYFKHVPPDDNGLGSSILERQEHVTVMASFYGPLAYDYAAYLRDGLRVNQNLDQLYAAGIKFTGIDGAITEVPELTNQQWINRRDLTLKFAREVDREYPILTIIAADVALETDDVRVDVIVDATSGT